MEHIIDTPHPELAEILDKAISFASMAHYKQIRWDGQPYIMHCIRVMLGVLPSEGSTPNEMNYRCAIVAILHDVIEDTEYSLHYVTNILDLPGDIEKALDKITKTFIKNGKTKTKSWDDYINDILDNKIAKRVKLADLHDNMNIKGPPKQRPINIKRLEKYRRAYYALLEGRAL